MSGPKKRERKTNSGVPRSGTVLVEVGLDNGVQVENLLRRHRRPWNFGPAKVLGYSRKEKDRWHLVWFEHAGSLWAVRKDRVTSFRVLGKVDGVAVARVVGHAGYFDRLNAENPRPRNAIPGLRRAPRTPGSGPPPPAPPPPA